MNETVLNSVKQQLNISPDQTAFDGAVLDHVNAAVSDLSFIGLGSVHGLEVTEATLWEDVFLSPLLSQAKSYVYLKVKLLYTPPASGFVIDMMERQLVQMTFRLNLAVEVRGAQ